LGIRVDVADARPIRSAGRQPARRLATGRMAGGPATMRARARAASRFVRWSSRPPILFPSPP